MGVTKVLILMQGPHALPFALEGSSGELRLLSQLPAGQSSSIYTAQKKTGSERPSKMSQSVGLWGACKAATDLLP